MSESTQQPLSSNQQTQNGPHSQVPSAGPGIDKREKLSPVSLAPIHVAEPSSILVLKNQKDLGRRSTSIGPFSQDDDDESEESDDEDGQSYDPESASIQDDLPPPHSTRSPQNGTAAGLVINGDPRRIPTANSGFTNNYRGNHPAEAPPGISSTIITEPTPQIKATESRPKSMPHVDLQALLTRLSPTMPQQATTTTATTTTATLSTLPSPPPSLPKPPPPTAHPLPAPVHAQGVVVKNTLRSGLPSSLPNPATFQHPKHAVPNSPTGTEEYEDRPFTTEEEGAYENFLEEEREYVTKGQWDRFPIGSRLFIGTP